MARDYQGLRQLLLDRLAQNLPDFSERHIPDVMIMLVELFAFLGDDLSYYQDAAATEAYLQTARRRTSIRRHGRLVGYRLHEGCHARAWIDVQVSADCDLPLDTVSFSAHPPTGTVTFSPLRATLPRPYAPGETAARTQPHRTVVPLRIAHNEIQIWDWGESNTFLPLGATEATLAQPTDKAAGALQLQPGDLLMFEETHGADGGPPDETHRHTVRLTRAEHDHRPALRHRRARDRLGSARRVALRPAGEHHRPAAHHRPRPALWPVPTSCWPDRANKSPTNHHWTRTPPPSPNPT